MTMTLQQAQRELDRAETSIRGAEARLAERQHQHAAVMRELREAEAYAERAADDPDAYARRYAQAAGPREALEKARRALDEAESEQRAAKEAAIEPRRAAVRAHRQHLDLLAERFAMLLNEAKPHIAEWSRIRSEMKLLQSECERSKSQLSHLSQHVRVSDPGDDDAAARYGEITRQVGQMLQAAPLHISAIADRALRNEVEAAGGIS